MNVPVYLERIQYSHTPKPDVATLRELQRAHMLTVPFENLDIGLKRPIQLSDKALWNKIVLQQRGGFCYELNGLFAWLLKQIGFDVTYLNARVFNSEGQLGIEFDHLALLVQVPGESERWLADVGFGDSFTVPLIFEPGVEQSQGLRAYRLEQTSAGYIMWQRNYSGAWEQEYFFDLQSHRFPEEYEAGCLYHQSSRSSFSRGNIISRATPSGRITIDGNRLIITTDGNRTEKPIANDDEYRKLLKEHFGIVL